METIVGFNVWVKSTRMVDLKPGNLRLRLANFTLLHFPFIFRYHLYEVDQMRNYLRQLRHRINTTPCADQWPAMREVGLLYVAADRAESAIMFYTGQRDSNEVFDD